MSSAPPPEPSRSTGAEDPSALLRRELAIIRSRGSGAAEGELETVADAFVVRYPAHGAELRRVLTSALETAGVPPREPPTSPGRADAVRKKSTDAVRRSPVVLPGDAPRRLGRYEIIRILGKGGMGLVYLGVDDAMGRAAAIKVLPADMTSSREALSRFQREATAIVELEHPSIVPVYEVGEDHGCHFYAMRYVDGVPLKEYTAKLLVPVDAGDDATGAGSMARTTRGSIGTHRSQWLAAMPFARATARRRPIATITADGLSRVLRVIEQVAHALEHAHQRGIIHRDVKPGNIMVDRDGMSQLLDFGLAKITTWETLTREGRILGTVPYMSPEQLAPKHGTVDHRSDVYSLGVTLFESITGTRPFYGESPEAVMFQILMKEPPSPRALVPEISQDIETVVLKCLEKSPGRRYQSCAELAEDLSRLRAHQRIEAERVGRLGRLVRWAERHRGLAAVTAILVLLLASLPCLMAFRTLAARRDRARLAGEALADARSLAARRRELRAELVTMREELQSVARAAPDHAPTGDPRKRRRLELEAGIAAALIEVDELASAARFSFDRAIRLGRDAAAERLRLVEELYVEAEAAGDGARLSALADELRAAGATEVFAGRGRLTLTTFPEGARVRIVRFETAADGVLQPGAEAVLEGVTPVEGVELPVGSLLATLSAPGRHDVRCPILIERGEHWGHPSWHGGRFRDEDWTVELPLDSIYDAKRWALVPGGPYQATADRDDSGLSPRLEWRWEPAFLIARHETRYAEYDRFFSAAATQERIRRSLLDNRVELVPRPQPTLGWLETVRSVPGEDEWTFTLEIIEAARELAVGGLSQTDAREYAEWLSEREDYVHSLPTASQWEKAARGVDGRPFPWGFEFDWSFTRGPWGRGGGLRAVAQANPAAPGTCEADVSPYGVRDLAGNAREWCADGPDLHEGVVNPYLAGGDVSLASQWETSFVTWPRTFYAYDNASRTWGFRLVRETRKKR